MRSWVLRLGREAAVYGLGKVMIGAFYLLLIPAYTRLLAPEEYGKIELFVQLQGLLTCFVVLGADTALAYHFFQVEAHDQDGLRRLVSARVQLLVSIGLTLSGIVLLTAPLVATLQGGWTLVSLALVGLLAQLCMVASVDLDRLRHRPGMSVGVNLLYVVLAGLFTLAVMAYSDRRVEAYFFGQIAGGLVASAVGWYGHRHLLDLASFQWDEARRLLRTGLPLLPAAVALYALTNSEKWLISWFLGAPALGVYAVAYRLASVVGFWMESFRQAFWPLAMEAINTEQGPGLFRVIAQLYLTLSTAAIFLLSGVGPLVVEFLVGPRFREAYPLLGILGWPFILSGLFSVVTPGFWKCNRSHMIPITAGAAALLSIGLNLVVIPRWGTYGAAATVVLSYATWNFASLAVSERLWPVRFPWLTMLALLAVGVAGTVGITWLTHEGESGVVATVLTLAGLVLYYMVRKLASAILRR
ncbi:MAG: lipopolysaccharide biosynthesis protein [Candidatus Eremiobacterota bacterium]